MRISDWFVDVVQFRHKMGGRFGWNFDRATLRQRRALMDEEWKEVCHAIRDLEHRNTDQNRKNLCAELVDLMYVTLGTFTALGVNPQPVWDAIHAANMQKVPNGDGKATKGEGWQKPEFWLRSLEDILPAIVALNRSREATPFGRLATAGAADHAPKLVRAIGQPLEGSARRRILVGHIDDVLPASGKHKRCSKQPCAHGACNPLG